MDRRRFERTVIYLAHSFRSAMRWYIVKMGFDARNDSSMVPSGLVIWNMLSKSLLVDQSESISVKRRFQYLDGNLWLILVIFDPM